MKCAKLQVLCNLTVTHSVKAWPAWCVKGKSCCSIFLLQGGTFYTLLCCDTYLVNMPTSHVVSLVMYACCGDSAMPLLSCASLCNNRKWCLPSLVSPSSCTVLLLWCFFSSLVPRPSLLFVLQFVFSIIYRSHVLYWTQSKEQKKTGEAWEQGYFFNAY